MSIRRRSKTLALLAAAALAQAALSDPARADDFGVPGNALQPAPVNPSTAGGWMEEESMGTRMPAARSPAGRFYDIPRSPVDLEEVSPGEDGWQSFGFVELGAIRLGGDKESQGFGSYKDVHDGGAILSFGRSAEHPEDARYIEVVGGGVGRYDQFYGVEFGRYNDWRVNAFYNETPHAYTSTYRSLWGGVGTGVLTLGGGLPPGGSANAAATQASVRNTLAGTDASELGVVRKKAAIRFDTRVSESWKFYTSYSQERRQGARPFGAVFGGGTNLEIPESIDSTTRDVVAGAQYRDPLNRVNVQASASIFRNNVDTMTFDNPLYAGLSGVTGLTSNSFTQGRFDLAPSNEHYNLKGEYGRSIPGWYKANFTATAAYGTMRQNDLLVPPTPFALTGGADSAQGVSLADNWNTAAALSRQRAGARIDTRMADLGLSLKPADSLTVKGKLRYYETRNHTEYWACNPLTGQWGRLLNDGTMVSFASANTTAGVNPGGTTADAYNAAGCDLGAVLGLNLVPAAGNVPIRNIPFDYRQENAVVSADYRLDRTASVDASLERETYRREHRERDRTWEDKIKVAYVNRDVGDGTLRVSAEHDRRRGSEFKADPYAQFMSAGFGPLPATDGVNMTSWLRGVAQLQKFDLADRDQNILSARFNTLFSANLEGAFALQWKDADYPGAVGRTGHQRQTSLSFDLDYKTGPSAVLYGFYAYQTGEMEQHGVQSSACVMGQTYYFYDNGQVLAPATIGGPPPTTPAGATLVATQTVTTANWQSVCGSASATSPLFPDGRGWDVRSKDRNDSIGVGLKYDFGRAKLDASFTRSLARTQIKYAYNPTALGMSATQQALAGDGFSDLVFAQNVLSLSVLVPLDKQVTLRFFERYESGVVRDWHYDGVESNPMPTAGSLYLDAGPQDYSVNLVGVLLVIRM